MAGSPLYISKDELGRLASGDESAFSSLFHLIAPRLHSYLNGITRSESATEELVQNTFIKVWLHRYQLADIENPVAWIYRVASNEAFNFLKRKNIERSAMLQVGQSTDLYARDDVAYNELKQNIAEAIAALPERRRIVWKLVREEGLKNAEAAKKLGISINTIKKTLTEAQKDIRDFLEKRGFLMLTTLFFAW